MLAMRDRLYNGLKGQTSGIRLNGHPDHRLPNTISVSFKDLEANRILDEISDVVAASAGAACHSDLVEVSHVLRAMEVPLEWAKGTIRFSVGKMTTEDEIDKIISAVASAVGKLRRTV